jgi:hypothetical protein
MSTLVHRRCWNHTERAAVCRCPGCSRDYCRECVTEHDTRLLCASCLRRLLRGPQRQGRRRVLTGAAAAAGMLLSWSVFYGVGRALMLLPHTQAEEDVEP